MFFLLFCMLVFYFVYSVFLYCFVHCFSFLLLYIRLHTDWPRIETVTTVPEACCLLACTVLDSWWRTERPSKTCRVLFQNKINLRYCASGWFYYWNILWCMVLQTSNSFVNFEKEITIIIMVIVVSFYSWSGMRLCRLVASDHFVWAHLDEWVLHDTKQ
jgi:hypothetical protein